MTKFNEFEAWFLTEAIKHYAEEAEKQVAEQQSKPRKGMQLLFAPGYFKMIGDDMTTKVTEMTAKKRGRKPRK